MIKELIKLANHLDSKGHSKEADYLDGIIKEAKKPWYKFWEQDEEPKRKTRFRRYFPEDEKNESFPETAFELGLSKYEETHKPFLKAKINKAINKSIDGLFRDAEHKEKHIKLLKIDMDETMKTLSTKVEEELGTFTESQAQIDAAAKKVVSADRDLNPFSLKNKHKRLLERAKR
mgnify:CR=1 FL=1|tara:strand:- start:328 stop:852 length:525 start_codon:yes stop_codon:yes gene_type:complete